MARASVEVRSATPGDLPDLVRLVAEMRETLRRRPVRAGEDESVQAEERLAAAFDSPNHEILVALDPSGTILGLTVLSLQAASGALGSAKTVLMVSTHVTRGARHAGVGRALVAGAAGWAELNGADSVEANVDPARREDLRFYVRLGFGQVFVRRSVPIAVLRRRLGQDSVAPPVATVGEALNNASRRGLRARIETARAVSERRRAH